MTLVQIQSFLEVARCKNISEAAKHLFITQPTLGRQLTAIENTVEMNRFDEESKHFLKHKEVLAVILKGTVREVEDLSLQEIMDLIEADTTFSWGVPRFKRAER